MNRRGFFGYGFSVLAAGTMPLLAKDDDDKHEKHGKKHGHREDDDERKHGNGHGGNYFRQEDAVYLREYYGPVNLPPGLRKKYYRTGKLPPGWEKRFRPLPPVVIQRLPPPPPYCERGYLDGYAVVYDRRTRIIVDVLDIVNAATGR